MIGPRHRGDPARNAEQPSAAAPASPGRAVLDAVTEGVVVLAMALALSLVIKTFLVQAFFIPSQSMENSLLVGDRVVVSKLTPGPFDLHRGDVVVFKDPGGWLNTVPAEKAGPVRRVVQDVLMFVGLLPSDSGQHLIKRVIGLPGDTVACCDEEGRVSVNQVPITEPYLYPGDVPSLQPFSVSVPAGRVWVMGDHRSVSQDSRYNPPGFVPIGNVVGKAFVVVWPFSRAGAVAPGGAAFAAVK